MSDIEIALEDLDTLVEIARQHMGIAPWLGIIQSALVIKDALEKQKPSIVDYSELNYSHLPVSKCSVCKNTTINRLLQCNYCPDCGQKLDWEEEDE